MFFSLSKILDFLLSPLIWCLVVLLAGILLRQKSYARKLIIASLIMFYFFSNSFIVDEFVRLSERPMVREDTLGTYDAGIVLGGGMVTYDRNFERLVFQQNTDRVLQAQLLYRKGHIKKILLSSGSGSLVFRDRLEAPMLKDYLIQSGIPAQDILMDSTSDNTYQNAVNSARILNDSLPGGKYLLITSALHMSRAQACFEKCGLHPQAFPVSKLTDKRRYDIGYLLVPEPYNLQTWEKLIHEWAGIIMYKLNGFI